MHRVGLIVDGSRKEVMILPFVVPPGLIVWRNRCFVDGSLTNDYVETSFAVAHDGADGCQVILQTAGHSFVARTMVPRDAVPGTPTGVIRWGERLFRFSGYTGQAERVYLETFWTMALNPETGEPEVYAEVHDG